MAAAPALAISDLTKEDASHRQEQSHQRANSRPASTGDFGRWSTTRSAGNASGARHSARARAGPGGSRPDRKAAGLPNHGFRQIQILAEKEITPAAYPPYE